jgi:endoglucanase
MRTATVWKSVGLCALLSLGADTIANCLNQGRLTGVNTAGAEFNLKNLPGTPFKDYTYPITADLTFFAERGANIIRFPFRWERLQPSLNGPLDAAELGRMRTTVNTAKAQGLCVLLDVHNFAKYYGDKLGENDALDEAFIKFWLLVAKEFSDPTQTIFGLMNEPANMPLAEWAVLAKRTLKALRDAEATNLVFVSGGRWSGVHDWFSGLLASNASEFDDLRDPLNRTVLEVHQYTDTDYSGTHTTATGTGCLPPDHFNSKFERISNWATENGQQLFLGEFGVPSSPECIATLTRLLELTQSPPWKGWAYWATGRWWGTYHMAISGYNQPLSPQWGPLSAFFYDAETDELSPPESPGSAVQQSSVASSAGN